MSSCTGAAGFDIGRGSSEHNASASAAASPRAASSPRAAGTTPRHYTRSRSAEQYTSGLHPYGTHSSNTISSTYRKNNKRYDYSYTDTINAANNLHYPNTNRGTARRSSDVGNPSERYSSTVFEGKATPSRHYQNCLPSEPDDSRVDMNLVQTKLLESRLHNSKTTDLRAQQNEKQTKTPESRFLECRLAFETRLHSESKQYFNTSLLSQYENRKFISSNIINSNDVKLDTTNGDGALCDAKSAALVSSGDVNGKHNYNEMKRASDVSVTTEGSKRISSGTVISVTSTTGTVAAEGGSASARVSRQLSSSVCTALYDYEAKGDDELSLHRGDILEVLSKDVKISGDEGWWTGKINGKVLELNHFLVFFNIQFSFLPILEFVVLVLNLMNISAFSQGGHLP